jgi:hypothetical protein
MLPICFGIFLLLISTNGDAMTAFSETFVKGKGTLSETRIVELVGTVGTLSIVNGPIPYDSINNGEIVLNGTVVFSGADFRATGFISKEVDLVNGANDLEVILKGGHGGAVYVEIDVYPSPPADTVFVSINDSAANDLPSCGLEVSTPCQSIEVGIDRALDAGKSTVAVANGTYVEDVTLVEGVHLSGGWGPDFLSADHQNSATIVIGTGLRSAAVIADSILQPTDFRGFVVIGPAVGMAGQNSIGIWVKDSSDALVIENNTILGGVGGRGADGGSGEFGADGIDGGPGAASVEGVATLPGGIGGDSGHGSAGGGGGRSVPAVFESRNGDGFPGQPGGTPVGRGGFNGQWQMVNTLCVVITGGNPLDAEDGFDGEWGDEGENGLGGADADSSLSSTGEWITDSGTNGLAGGNGQGGGGGGAGGGVEGDDTTCRPPVTGPSGGGGGEGGAGGTGGWGGQGGGAVFGIFVFNENDGASAPVIRNNLVFLGAGGNGGHGGAGGSGGSAGIGGPGGICVVAYCGPAGMGGDGGRGGHGGGGGGGAGGASIGIYSNVVAGYGAANFVDASTATPGLGGGGGVTLGSLGEAGEDGGVYEVMEP